MPALQIEQLHQLSKRRNFAKHEPGVILVFAIVGTLVLLITGIMIHKKLAARKAAKAVLAKRRRNSLVVNKQGEPIITPI